MCGIAGFTARVSVSDAQSAIRDMVEALGHRGPDGSGSWTAPSPTRRISHKQLSSNLITENGWRFFFPLLAGWLCELIWNKLQLQT